MVLAILGSARARDTLRRKPRCLLALGIVALVIPLHAAGQTDSACHLVYRDAVKLDDEMFARRADAGTAKNAQERKAYFEKSQATLRTVLSQMQATPIDGLDKFSADLIQTSRLGSVGGASLLYSYVGCQIEARRALAEVRTPDQGAVGTLGVPSENSATDAAAKANLSRSALSSRTYGQVVGSQSVGPVSITLTYDDAAPGCYRLSVRNNSDVTIDAFFRLGFRISGSWYETGWLGHDTAVWNNGAFVSAGQLAENMPPGTTWSTGVLYALMGTDFNSLLLPLNPPQCPQVEVWLPADQYGPLRWNANSVQALTDRMKAETFDREMLEKWVAEKHARDRQDLARAEAAKRESSRPPSSEAGSRPSSSNTGRTAGNTSGGSPDGGPSQIAGPGVLFTEADALFEAGNINGARAALRLLIAQYPDHALAYTAAARLSKSAESSSPAKPSAVGAAQSPSRPPQDEQRASLAGDDRTMANCKQRMDSLDSAVRAAGARPLPPGSSPPLMRVLWALSEAIKVLDSYCPPTPEYRKMRSEYEQTYRQTESTCASLASGRCPGPRSF